MPRMLFAFAAESVTLAAAVFDVNARTLLARGCCASVEGFERFVKNDLQMRGLHVGEVASGAAGIAALTAVDDGGNPVRQYLAVTTQQLPTEWESQASTDEPPVAAFGLERGPDGVPTGAYLAGAFLSPAELQRNREFAASVIKGFDSGRSFALLVPLRSA